MIEQLDGERFVSVQTFRHSGDLVATPVWFALFEDGFVFGTHSDSGKVKRIRAEPAVRFAAANYRGLERHDYTEGCAEVLGGDEAVAAEAALSAKYGWQWFPFSRLIDCYVRVVTNGASTPTVDDLGSEDSRSHREKGDAGDQELEPDPEVEHHIGDRSGDQPG